jgi:hypothetical protein
MKAGIALEAMHMEKYALIEYAIPDRNTKLEVLVLMPYIHNSNLLFLRVLDEGLIMF